MRGFNKGVAGALAAVMIATTVGPAIAALVQRKPPYYASIAAGRARMRTGPARTYPAIWQYQRADLPVKVIDTYEHGNWLKVEDPGGTQGWMLGSLIRDTRTGFVMGPPAELFDQPHADARIRWRAAPGVVGRLSKCARGWCYFDVRGRGGYIETIHLWGVDPTEIIP
ncbi:SH3 domain-containing protein [Sphingomonas sp. CA1-15]|uniref:SH3 domain-containing protein n=2 Tax=Sphingomonas immobilis TaxID=3063997 RepID=A0ABT8ZZR6_9SPHN|nr:SH3 domain-containing protein [Sphingomonas sp. CA1-15]